MLLQSREEINYTKLIQLTVDKISEKGFENIRAETKSTETPYSLIGKNNDLSFIPDATATKNDQKYYFELGVKEENTSDLVNKWKLLETVAHMKKGKLEIFSPRGHLKFTQQLIKDHHIQATVSKL